MAHRVVEQRWRRGRDRWVHPGGPRFVPARYEVDVIDEAAARPFIETHHYAHSYPAARFAYGLFDTLVGQLVGVAVYAVPVNVAVLTGPFPALTPYEQSIELSRLVLLDDVPFNSGVVVRRPLPPRPGPGRHSRRRVVQRPTAASSP